ncbi:MAG TPA: NAD(P)H-binding protein [Ferruginibacter sp.]|nr:NAD(P)H-binding protein [Ferruginibacter sp.]HRN90928.1 NAD(P)H-binding protein [Ferruginibacter sp.]HRO05323.1 NAD(P)H-binding protein [Ferruginibacter sp.]HRO96087.1 NAD(P)H-binding protein [Ferruginibacter sp.]HRP48579.1 NAD(P)H-binding protein [Ferruginibacter sp.]
MQITVFGATTLAGKQLVLDGLALNHTMVAFGRNVFTADFPENDLLILKNGALFDDQDVLNALLGSDAVIAALEGATDGTDVTRSLGMKHIVTQMNRAGIKRIIALGGPGILDGADEQMRMFDEDFPEDEIPLAAEHLKALQWLETSGVEWTMFAAENIIAGSPNGEFTTQVNRLPDSGKKAVTAGNLALCCYQAISKSEFINTRVGISDN